MVEAYWNIGRVIVEKQGGNDKAEYGTALLKNLSKEMTKEFGKGFTLTNLKYMRQFYLTFPKSYALHSELSWTHYRLFMRVENDNARNFYMEECIKSNWSTRQLERQITTLFYERILSSKNKEKVAQEIYKLELGRGFSFVARQKRITFDGRHFYIDLVFYNYILKCFVLIDLKIGDLTHQDLGKMQMYVHYYEDKMMTEGDNPPIGIVLCADKSDSIVKYTLPK